MTEEPEQTKEQITLSESSLKEFFSSFLEKYKEQVNSRFSEQKQNLALINSLPVKFEFLFDKDMNYGIILISKSSRTEFVMDNSHPAPAVVSAAASHKKYIYGEQNKFLYLFQTNAKRFPTWTVDGFVNDFIKYELAKDKFR